MRRYQIEVAFDLDYKWTLTVTAKNANEAVIDGLCGMGLTTLSLVTGITIYEL